MKRWCLLEDSFVGDVDGEGEREKTGRFWAGYRETEFIGRMKSGMEELKGLHVYGACDDFPFPFNPFYFWTRICGRLRGT